MQFDVTILGSNGAIAAFDRFPSSQAINYNGHVFIVDCGEGTQFRMNRFGIKRGKLDHIFISHLHGDHYYGLIGLLTSFNLNWREHPLHIYAPEGLEEIVKLQFKYSNTQLKFAIHFHTNDTSKNAVIFEDKNLVVETLPLIHRIPTCGFLFREKKPQRKILPEKIAEYNIPFQLINDIKSGADYTTTQGRVISNATLTTPALPPRSYAYCSDTAYTEQFIDRINGIDLLYHEATFVHEHEFRAAETFHTTTKQAAALAKKAGVKKLLIGHFSARYENLQVLLDECREVFPETYLAIEGSTFTVDSSDQ